MDTKLKGQIIAMQVSIDNNKQFIDDKQKETDSKIDKIDKWMKNIMDKFDNTSPNKAEEKNPQDSTTMVCANRNAAQLEGGHYKKIGGMWTLKHEISYLKFYEIITKNEMKGDNDIYIKIFKNQIKM